MSGNLKPSMGNCRVGTLEDGNDRRRLRSPCQVTDVSPSDVGRFSCNGLQASWLADKSCPVFVRDCDLRAVSAG